MKVSLTDKVIAITGGARGIGRATAVALAGEGARVAIGDLDLGVAKAAASALDGEVLALELDVTDRGSFERFLGAVERALGPIDVLVNNAGIQHVGAFASEDDAATERQIAVNLIGVMLGTKLALALMLPRRRGRIVNLASAAGKVATPGGATYCATKHAVVGLTESVREEIAGSGVEVTAVLPAIIDTEMAGGIAKARGVRAVPPETVGRAIARAIIRGRPIVYVPAYTGAINALLTALPRRPRTALRRLMRIDEILTQADPFARAAYEARAAASAPGRIEDRQSDALRGHEVKTTRTRERNG